MYFVIRIDQKSICFVTFSLSNTENYTWSDKYRLDNWGQFHQRFTSSFLCTDPKRAKRQRWLDCLLALLGREHKKAEHKTVMKSTTDNCVFTFLRYAFTGWKKFPKNKIKHVFTCFLVWLLLLCSNKGFANKLDYWLIK